jgi:predicted nucleotidyltransferase
MPNMGMKSAKPKPQPPASLADTLFSSTQQRVLGRLFGQPDRSFYATELIAAGGGSGAVQRELARLEASGLVESSRIGNQKHYQANRQSPIFEELHGIVLKTLGVADVLRAALVPLADRVDLAFIYGSVANGTDTARSNIDVLLVGDEISYSDVLEVLTPCEKQLGRAVNPTIYSNKELQKKQAVENSFLERALTQPRIVLMGADDAINEPG